MADDQHYLDKLYDAISECDDEESEKITNQALEGNVSPSRLIDTAIKAIEKVGQDFEDGTVFVPELMLAGMGMEKVMSLAQKKMLQMGEEPPHKGKLLIGTVAGDLHNIGKDLVVSLWRAKGYQVYDLGVNVPASRFVSVAEEFNADVVGLSSLMSTTLIEQQSVMEFFESKGTRDQYKIVIGGGVCTREWADRIGADGYAEDAARAVKLVEKLLAGKG